jgi:hypothetical protein
MVLQRPQEDRSAQPRCMALSLSKQQACTCCTLRSAMMQARLHLLAATPPRKLVTASPLHLG